MKIMHSLKSNGIVYFISGKMYKCSFEINIYIDGSIIALLNILNEKQFSYSLSDELELIEGSTIDGYLKSVGKITTLKSPFDKYSSSFQVNDFIVKLERLNIRSNHKYNNVFLKNFLVCNLSLPFLTSDIKVKLDSSNHIFLIKPLKSYESTVFNLNIFKNIEPTVLVTTKELDNKYIENVFLILSVLSGTYVNYIAQKVIGPETYTLFESRITRPFAGLQTVRINSEIELNIILNHVLDSNGDFRKKLITRYLILSYLDIIDGNNYLETRAIKIAAWFEQLKDHIVHEFNQYENKSFRKKMIFIIAKVNCRHDIPYSKICLLVKCRNSLIHQGNFFSKTANKSERKKYQLSCSFDEYIFLLQIVHILILRGINYSGIIKDYRKEFRCKGDFA